MLKLLKDANNVPQFCQPVMSDCTAVLSTSYVRLFGVMSSYFVRFNQ